MSYKAQIIEIMTGMTRSPLPPYPTPSGGLNNTVARWSTFKQHNSKVLIDLCKIVGQEIGFIRCLHKHKCQIDIKIAPYLFFISTRLRRIKNV
jgi:hypothetical protein